MSFWQILGRFAFSDQGETIQKVSDTTSVSSDGTTYTRMGSTTVGSDGSVLTSSASHPIKSSASALFLFLARRRDRGRFKFPIA